LKVTLLFTLDTVLLDIDVFPAYLALWARYAGKFERKRGGCEEPRSNVGASSKEKARLDRGHMPPNPLGSFIRVHSLRAIARGIIWLFHVNIVT